MNESPSLSANTSWGPINIEPITTLSSYVLPWKRGKDDRVVDIEDADRFKLDGLFLLNYSTRSVNWGPMGEVVYRRTYSREKEDGTYERWWETVQRVVEGVYTYQKWHCKRLGLPWSDSKAQRSAQEMYEYIFDFKFTPPGRGLWMAGTKYVEKYGSAALNNCGFATTANIAEDFSRPFCWLMDMSMLGVGVGGDTKGAGTVEIKEPIVDPNSYWFVEDSREGWVDLIRIVLDSYIGKREYPGHIDYSKVRPAGTPIKGFGGTAAGSAPLERCVQAIDDTLRPLIGKTITSEAIVDLFDHIGVCVVSGNVRRSAIIMLGDPKDKSFAELKNPEVPGVADKLMSHRWAANHSINATVGMNYTDCAASTEKNGEPGYVWMNTARNYGRLMDPPDGADAKAVGTNPCSEQTLEDLELCCLVETFPSRCKDSLEYYRVLKYAYLYAKSITLVPTHNTQTNAVQMKNRRMGISQTGIIAAMNKFGRHEYLNGFCNYGYVYVKRMDGVYSDWLCVPRSKKLTSVKPSGTTSLLPGVPPGIHYPHAEYYLRTIRMDAQSPIVSALAQAGYRIEDDVYDRSGRRVVVYFPVKEENFSRAKEDVSMWEQLDNAAALQRYWADNQVSITVTFKPNEGKDIANALRCYEDKLKSVSFLPLTDHQYEQAPYQTITKEEYEEYARMLEPVVFDRAEHEVTEKFCDGDTCTLF